MTIRLSSVTSIVLFQCCFFVNGARQRQSLHHRPADLNDGSRASGGNGGIVFSGPGAGRVRNDSVANLRILVKQRPVCVFICSSQFAEFEKEFDHFAGREELEDFVSFAKFNTSTNLTSFGIISNRPALYLLDGGRVVRYLSELKSTTVMQWLWERHIRFFRGQNSKIIQVKDVPRPMHRMQVIMYGRNVSPSFRSLARHDDASWFFVRSSEQKVVIRHPQEPALELPFVDDLPLLEAFYNRARIPMFGAISTMTSNLYDNIDLIWVLLPMGRGQMDGVIDEYRAVLEDFSKSLPRNYALVYLDTNVTGAVLAQEFGIIKFPCMLMQKASSSLNYVFKTNFGSKHSKRFLSWIDAVEKGRVVPDSKRSLELSTSVPLLHANETLSQVHRYLSEGRDVLLFIVESESKRHMMAGMASRIRSQGLEDFLIFLEITRDDERRLRTASSKVDMYYYNADTAVPQAFECDNTFEAIWNSVLQYSKRIGSIANHSGPGRQHQLIKPPPTPTNKVQVLLYGPKMVKHSKLGGLRSKSRWFYLKSESYRVVIRHPLEAPIEVHLQAEFAGLKAVWRKNRFPLFGEINRSIYRRYAQIKRPLIWVLLPMNQSEFPAMIAAHRKSMEALAGEFPGMSVVYADTSARRQFIRQITGQVVFPSVVFQPQAGNSTKYFYDGDFSLSSVLTWMRGIKNAQHSKPRNHNLIKKISRDVQGSVDILRFKDLRSRVRSGSFDGHWAVKQETHQHLGLAATSSTRWIEFQIQQTLPMFQANSSNIHSRPLGVWEPRIVSRHSTDNYIGQRFKAIRSRPRVQGCLSGVEPQELKNELSLSLQSVKSQEVRKEMSMFVVGSEIIDNQCRDCWPSLEKYARVSMQNAKSQELENESSMFGVGSEVSHVKWFSGLTSLKIRQYPIMEEYNPNVSTPWKFGQVRSTEIVRVLEQFRVDGPSDIVWTPMWHGTRIDNPKVVSNRIKMCSILPMVLSNLQMKCLSQEVAKAAMHGEVRKVCSTLPVVVTNLDSMCSKQGAEEWVQMCSILPVSLGNLRTVCVQQDADLRSLDMNGDLTTMCSILPVTMSNMQQMCSKEEYSNKPCLASNGTMEVALRSLQVSNGTCSIQSKLFLDKPSSEQALALRRPDNINGTCSTLPVLFSKKNKRCPARETAAQKEDDGICSILSRIVRILNRMSSKQEVIMRSNVHEAIQATVGTLNQMCSQQEVALRSEEHDKTVGTCSMLRRLLKILSKMCTKQENALNLDRVDNMCSILPKLIMLVRQLCAKRLQSEVYGGIGEIGPPTLESSYKQTREVVVRVPQHDMCSTLPMTLECAKEELALRSLDVYGDVNGFCSTLPVLLSNKIRTCSKREVAVGPSNDESCSTLPVAVANQRRMCSAREVGISSSREVAISDSNVGLDFKKVCSTLPIVLSSKLLTCSKQDVTLRPFNKVEMISKRPTYAGHAPRELLIIPKHTSRARHMTQVPKQKPYLMCWPSGTGHPTEQLYPIRYDTLQVSDVPTKGRVNLSRLKVFVAPRKAPSRVMKIGSLNRHVRSERAFAVCKSGLQRLSGSQLPLVFSNVTDWVLLVDHSGADRQRVHLANIERATNGTRNLRFAVVDGNKNDSPLMSLKWRKVPSLFYVHKGHATPLPFGGRWNYQTVFRWIQVQHGDLHDGSRKPNHGLFFPSSRAMEKIGALMHEEQRYTMMDVLPEDAEAIGHPTDLSNAPVDLTFMGKDWRKMIPELPIHLLQRLWKMVKGTLDMPDQPGKTLSEEVVFAGKKLWAFGQKNDAEMLKLTELFRQSHSLITFPGELSTSEETYFRERFGAIPKKCIIAESPVAGSPKEFARYLYSGPMDVVSTSKWMNAIEQPVSRIQKGVVEVFVGVKVSDAMKYNLLFWVSKQDGRNQLSEYRASRLLDIMAFDDLIQGNTTATFDHNQQTISGSQY